jgi:hypothetical protein
VKSTRSLVRAIRYLHHVQRVSAKHGVKDDCAFLWEHAIFRHPPNKIPLTDRSEILHSWLVGKTTKHAKNGYNRMGRGGSPYRWNISMYTLPYLTLLYFTYFFVTKPTDQTTEPICTHDISNDADCSKEVPFRGLIDEKSFTRKYPFPKIFKGHFTCKSKKTNNFGQVKDNRKIPKQTYTKSGSSNRTVTSIPV